MVDDEALARRRILSLLKPDSSFEVLAECADGGSAIRAISEQRPDLVFLDVQMPGIDGFGVLEAVADRHLPAIIFVTAHDRYAVKAFDAHAVDYLLKPFKQDRFLEALARARKAILAGSDAVDEKLLSLLRSVGGQRGRLVIRSKGKIIFLRHSEIEWIEAASNYVRVHAGAGIYSVRETIGDFQKMLADSDAFVRVHRSVIVNLDAVSELQRCGSGEYVVILRSGKELPLGRTYQNTLVGLLSTSR